VKSTVMQMLYYDEIEKILNGRIKSIGRIQEGSSSSTRRVEYSALINKKSSGCMANASFEDVVDYLASEGHDQTDISSLKKHLERETKQNTRSMLENVLHIQGATVFITYLQSGSQGEIALETDVNYDNIDDIITRLLEEIPCLELYEEVRYRHVKLERSHSGLILNDKILDGYPSRPDPEIILET